MQTTKKLLTGSLLTALVLTIAMPTSAEAFGFGRGRFGGGAANLSDEVKEALQTCREHETREEKRACAQAVAEENNLELPARRGRHGGAFANLSDEAKEALQACRELETREEKRTCVQGVAEDNGIELSARQGRRGRGGRFGGVFGSLTDEQKTALRAELTACRENNEDHSERRECARTAIEQYRN